MRRASAPPAAVIGGLVAGGINGSSRWTGRAVNVAGRSFVVTDDVRVWESCRRCGDGRGRLPHQAHVLGGVCFACGGAGLGPVVPGGIDEARETVRKRILAAASAARRATVKADAAAATARAARESWEVEHPDLAAGLDAVVELARSGVEVHGHLHELAFEAMREGCLSVEDAAYAGELLAEREAETRAAAAREDARRAFRWVGSVGERIEVAGTVVVAVTVDGWHPGSSQRLVVVESGTTLAKVSTAARWADAVRRGDAVRLVGAVKAHVRWDGAEQTVLTRVKVAAGGC
jgi:hypothetical protein